jgi:hypothetical protein
MDLSIIIVSYNTRQALKECLASIFAETTGISFEVLVVDNGSSDGSAAMVASDFPTVRLMENKENIGFARAVNYAIPLSTGRYILLLNSDTVVLDRTTAKMVEFMDGEPEACVAGCTLLNSDGSFQQSYDVFPRFDREIFKVLRAAARRGLRRTPLARWLLSSPTAETTSKKVDMIQGSCFMIRRSAIERVGLFDENYFMYLEETDLCFRVRSSGGAIYYTPAGRVIHHIGGSWLGDTLGRRHRYWKSYLYFIRKNYNLLRRFPLELICFFRLMILGLEKRWHRTGSPGPTPNGG